MKQGYFTLNSFCNQKCITCPTSSNSKCDYSIPFDVLKNQINESISKGLKIIVLSGGEPLAYPRFDDLLRFLFKKKVGIVILSNCTLLCDSMIKKLAKHKEQIKFVTAIHSDNAEEHDKVTGTNGSFNKTVNNLERANKSGLNISVKIILNKINYQKLSLIASFLNYRFTKPFNINVCSMDFVGVAQDHKELMVSGKEIEKSLNDAAVWFIHNNGKKFSLTFSEFPICLMTKYSMPFLSVSSNKRQFAYVGRDGCLKYNSLSDCSPCLANCSKCKFEMICPGVWSSTKIEMGKFCFPLGGDNNE